MTVAEYLRNEGREEGQRVAALRIAREMLKNGLALTLVISVTGIDEQTLNQPEDENVASLQR